MSCLPVEVIVQTEEFVLDGLAFGLCFFFGMLIGAALFLCIGWLCIRDVKARRDPDGEKGPLYESDDEYVRVTKPTKSRPSTAITVVSSKKQRMRSAKKKKGGDDEPLVPIVVAKMVEIKAADPAANKNTKQTGKTTEEPSSGGSGGLVTVLERKSSGDMDVEIAGQGVEAVDKLERELKAESIMTGIQILRSVLSQQLGKGRVSEEEYKEVVQGAQERLMDTVRETQEEQQREEEEINKKIKDPAQRQEEKEKLHGKYATKLNGLLAAQKEKLRADLQKKSGLNSDEIDAILAQYSAQVANVERKLSAERNRQVANLEERLARRKYLAEMHNQEKKAQRNEVEHRKDTNEQMLQSLVTDGKLSDKQKEDLLKQYDNDVMRLQNQQELDFETQKKKLAEKLRRAREQKMQKLTEEQDKDKEDFVKHTEQTKPSDVVDQYHHMLQKQREERDKLSDQLDEKEADDFNKLLKEADQDKQKDLEDKENEFQKKVKATAQLSESDMNRMLDIHAQEMQEYERIKKSDKKKMKQKLEEKLAERRRKAEEQLVQNEAEQQTVREQQDDTIKKVIESQKELSKDSRDAILNEHERNMTAIQNQLQMSKLRQQKLVEQKMAARRAKVEDLKAKQEEVSRNKRQYKDAERAKVEAQLAKQIEEEEARLDKERKQLTNEMRQRMAQETEAALAEQDKQMGILIGRLQVGQARRQAIISRQDKTLKELESKMQAQVAEGGRDSITPTDNEQVDHLLKKHQREVSELDEQLMDAKERQARDLQDKLQAKKARKEREVEDKMARERGQSNRGAMISSSILQNVMLEQRHKMEIKRLEKEMELEMKKQREQLNEQLEQELQVELEERKKNFLAQIAALKGMSKNEVSQLVDEAVYDAGGDERDAKKLRKEFNQDVQRAKTDLGVDDQHLRYRRKKLPPLRNTPAATLHSNEYPGSPRVQARNPGSPHVQARTPRQPAQQSYHGYQRYENESSYEQQSNVSYGYHGNSDSADEGYQGNLATYGRSIYHDDEESHSDGNHGNSSYASGYQRPGRTGAYSSSESEQYYDHY